MFTNRETLRQLIVDLAIRRGPITLSSGAVSAYYFDCRRLTLNSEGAAAVGDAMTEIITRLPATPRAIGGPTLGADPIVSSVMMRALQRGLRIDGFYVRKTQKQHGTKTFVENEPKAGTPVVIVEDVVTSGKSVIEAIDRSEAIGCVISAVITIVDRLEGGSEAIRQRVPKATYTPLFTLTDFPEIERIKQEVAAASALS